MLPSRKKVDENRINIGHLNEFVGVFHKKIEKKIKHYLNKYFSQKDILSRTFSVYHF